MSIIQDFAIAFMIVMQTRRTNKAGMTVSVQSAQKVPVIPCGYWLGTMEGCLLSGELNKSVKVIFDGFDEETKHALTFTPNAGEWATRARFWQEVLKVALPPAQYYAAIGAILGHYIRCIKMRKCVS